MNNRLPMPSTFISPGIPDNSCPVCLEEMSDRRDVLVTVCNHHFHEYCITRWLTLKDKDLLERTCVLCRTNAVPLVREEVPVGWQETNRFVVPAELRAVCKGQRDGLAIMLARNPGIVHQCYQSVGFGESGAKGYLLYIAAGYGNSDIVSQLLAARAKVNATQSIDGQENGWTALMVAAREGHVDVVEQLLNAGARCEAPSRGMISPLYLAVWKGHAEVVRLLIGAKAKIDGVQRIQGRVKRTALREAVEAGRADIVKLLLDAGARPDNPDIMKSSLLEKPVLDGRADIIKLLLDAGVTLDVPDQTTPPLFYAIEFGYAAIVKLLLNAIKARAKNEDKAKAMVNAAGYVLSFDDPWGADKDDWTALMVAVRNGRSRVVRLLLDAGAEIHVRRKNGLSPLHIAARHNRWQSLQLLINHKADVNDRQKPASNARQNSNGAMPLHLAAKYGSLACLRLLIENGADINATLTDGSTALHLASAYGYSQCLQSLIENGADINATLTDGSTPLHMAAKNGNWTCLKPLIENKANPHLKTNSDETPLDLANKWYEEHLWVKFEEFMRLRNALKTAMKETEHGSITKDYNQGL